MTKYGSSERPGVDIVTSQEINLKKTVLFFGPLEYDEVASLGVGLEDKILVALRRLQNVAFLLRIVHGMQDPVLHLPALGIFVVPAA